MYRIVLSLVCLTATVRISEQISLDKLRSFNSRWSFPQLDFGFDIFDSDARDYLRGRAGSSTASTDKCPSTPSPFSIRPGRMHRLYGACYTFGRGKHSCKGDDLICCKNSEGYNMCQYTDSYEPEIGPDGIKIPPKGLLNHLYDDGAPPEPQDFCPEPVLSCDPSGKYCATACVAYSGTHEPCSADISCPSGKVCCQDPCGPSQFCFQMTSDVQEKVQPVDEISEIKPIKPYTEEKSEETEKKVVEKETEKKETKEKPKESQPSPPVVEKAFANQPEGKCPAKMSIDAGCLGWQDVPGVNNPNDGICDTDAGCNPGYSCCEIDSCGQTKYCIKGLESIEIPEGCPIETVKYIDFERKRDDCKPNGCESGEICCPLDMQGNNHKIKCELN